MNYCDGETNIPGFDETDSVPLSLLNFTRGVATKNDASHLESRCNDCGFRLSSLDETLDPAEGEHAARCFGMATE